MDVIAALRTFLRVADTGSFSAVAAELGVTQPAISRQLSALEQQLGARLVHRSTHAVTLTEEGRDLLRPATHRFGRGLAAVRGPNPKQAGRPGPLECSGGTRSLPRQPHRPIAGQMTPAKGVSDALYFTMSRPSP